MGVAWLLPSNMSFVFWFMFLIASSQSGEDSKEVNGTPKNFNGKLFFLIVETWWVVSIIIHGYKTLTT